MTFNLQRLDIEVSLGIIEPIKYRQIQQFAGSAVEYCFDSCTACPYDARFLCIQTKTMLKQFIDPLHLADSRSSIDAEVSLRFLPRLVEISSTSDHAKNMLKVELDFSRDHRHRACVSGKISGSVTLQCQRCMQDVVQEVEANTSLLVVKTDEQAKALSSDLDPWLVGDKADLYELLEDEVLLELPQVALHPVGECQPPENKHAFVDEPIAATKKNPFEVLKNLHPRSGQ